MEIPCHFSSQIDDSLVKIDTKFHDYSMSFFQVLFVFHAQTRPGFWTSSSHGISMAFAKKTMGFPSDLTPFSIKLPPKRQEKIPVTFFTGSLLKFLLNSKHKLCTRKGNMTVEILGETLQDMFLASFK